MSYRCLGSLPSVARKPFLSVNSSILSYRMKAEEEASSFKLMTDHGLHHRASMVAFVSKFSGSSFFSMGMVTWGHPWGVKSYSIGIKARVKRSRNLQKIEKNHAQA